MSYEPKGKVAVLFDAMRASSETRSVWTSGEVAAVMQIPQAHVSVYVNAAIKNGALHHRLVYGRASYSLRPFPIDTAPAAPKDVRPGWTAPTMSAPRGAQNHVPPATPRPEPAVQRAQRFPLLPEQQFEPAAEESVVEEEAAEPMEFDANLHLDGDLDLYGLVELEDGGMRIAAENVARLRTWLGGPA